MANSKLFLTDNNFSQGSTSYASFFPMVRGSATNLPIFTILIHQSKILSKINLLEEDW
jgi:hypothetical protein